MRPEIDALLAVHGGAVSRSQVLAAITRNQLDDEVARGHLLCPFPRAYCRPWDGEHLPVLRRAALASVGHPVALSHTTALAVWQLRCTASNALHVTVPIGRHPVGRTPGLIVHRTRNAYLDGRSDARGRACRSDRPVVAAPRPE